MKAAGKTHSAISTGTGQVVWLCPRKGVLSTRSKTTQQGDGRVALCSFIKLLGNGDFLLGTQDLKKDSLKRWIFSKASCLSKDSVVAQDFSISILPGTVN